MDRAQIYRVRKTPTVIIGGRYLVTPDSVGARHDLFAQLLNGLVSRIL